MSNDSMKKLRPRSKDGKPSKRAEEAFRSPKEATPRLTKTSLTLDQDKYNQLRMYSLVEGVPLREIFDTAMDWYINQFVGDSYAWPSQDKR